MNRQAKHTPGEWKLARDGTPFVYALNALGFNRMWFRVSAGNLDDKSRTTDEELLAVANLCSAAPKLLAALRELVKALTDLLACHAEGGFVKPDDDVLAAARSALARAAAEIGNAA